MKKFLVSGTATVSCWTVVEAENSDHAIEIAKERYLADIHIDGSCNQEECFHLENDGAPAFLSAQQI